MFKFGKMVEMVVIGSRRNIRGTLNVSSLTRKGLQSHQSSPWFGNSPGKLLSVSYQNWLDTEYDADDLYYGDDDYDYDE